MTKLYVIHPQIETDIFRPAAHKWPDLVAVVGRLSPEKNIAAAISAVAELSWAHLWIFGGGSLQASLAEQANSISNNRVLLMGNVSNGMVARALSLSEFFVLPSLYDQAPKSLWEAMSAGCLCIVSAQVGVVEDGVTGYLCNPDPHGIMAALERARVDPGRERIREAARKHVLTAQAAKG